MKFSLQLLICTAAASHLSKEKSHMFLKSVTRSKCGDNCAKSKDNCHRNCERAGGNVSRCDCCCNNEMKGCKCKQCGFEDACEEHIWEPCSKLSHC